ncbi:DUF6049 family protein [Demequina lignilytica]|uniref:DUF6049 family protein n=1 Tax=Demequina lignilytica TaxID=3051663 RepID=A0AB35MIH5_9MICO|nr:DUF6049 family protein [Demequina sp. SYSU T0a273]MDN4483460.1 DUF6049 family protein [Demequina sp. SYSU T0a273]
MTGTGAMTVPRPFARLLALASALALGAGVALGTAAPATATPTPDASDTPAPSASSAPTAEPAVPVGTLTAELVMYPASVAEPGGSIRALARITNGTSEALDDAVLELALTTAPLTSTTAVDRFLSAPSGLAAVGTTPVGAAVPTAPDPDADPDAEPATVHRLAAGGSTLAAVAAAGEDLGLPDDAWGVYGLSVTLVAGGVRTTISTGVITWAGDGIPELEAAMLVTAAGPGAAMSTVTDAPGLQDVAIATDGTQLIGLDAGGVALSGRTVLRMPAYVPDVLSLAHAGDDSLLAFAVERARGTSTSATHDSAWISPVVGLDAATVALLSSGGASAALLMDGSAAGEAAVEHEAETGLAVLSPEPTLSAVVAADAALETPATAVATAALIAADASGPVLIAPDPGWLALGADPAALTAIAEAPFVTALDVTSLLTDVAAPALTVPADDQLTDADVSASAVVGQAHRLERGNALAVTVEDPESVLGPLGTTLLEPLATSLRDEPDRREAALAGAASRAEDLLDSLSVPAGSDINLIAAKGSVPVNVRNELTVPAEVTVDVTSFSPNLQVRDAPTVTVPASSSMTVLVEVEAVSTADVNAAIVLRNADGTALGPSTALSVRVRADWGNAVTAVFTAGLVLLLIMGVIRTIRRGRKDTRTGPQPEAGDTSAPAGTSTSGDDA